MQQEYRIFRSSSDKKLFAVHTVDSKENSLGIVRDFLQFEDASDMLEVLQSN